MQTLPVKYHAFAPGSREASLCAAVVCTGHSKPRLPATEGGCNHSPYRPTLQGRLIVYFENSFFNTASRHPDVPAMTAQQAAALETFSSLADSDELRMDYILQPGDIQLVRQSFFKHQTKHCRGQPGMKMYTAVQGLAFMLLGSRLELRPAGDSLLTLVSPLPCSCTTTPSCTHGQSTLTLMR